MRPHPLGIEGQNCFTNSKLHAVYGLEKKVPWVNFLLGAISGKTPIINDRRT